MKASHDFSIINKYNVSMWETRREEKRRALSNYSTKKQPTILIICIVKSQESKMRCF